MSLDFENLVGQHYSSLYKFAFSLTRAEADACDLTQQTFYIWAAKGHELRDLSKVKTWLFTTLHREFLKGRRRLARFPHYELSEMEAELPEVSPARLEQMDSQQVVQALGQIEEAFQAPVALFYLEDHSYKEIADILDIPMGTVKSRIARGLQRLERQLAGAAAPGKDAHE